MMAYNQYNFKNSPVGYANHEVIYDGNNKPIDYRFIEVNDAFLEMTGFSSDIVGKTVIEYAPEVLKESTDWVRIYSEVALTGNSVSLERYSKSLNQWYVINAFSPSEGFFNVLLTLIPDGNTTIFSDTQLKLNYYRNESLLRIMSTQTKVNEEFLDYALTEAIRLTKSDIGYIYFYDETSNLFTLNSWSNKVMASCSIVEKQTTYQLEKTGFWGEVIRQKKAIINNNFKMPHTLKKGFPEGHAALDKFMSLPIFDQGKIVAVIGLGNKIEDYNEEDIFQIQHFMEEVWNVYKRRQAEENLKKEKEHLHTTIETISDGIITLDKEHKILNINKVALQLLNLGDKRMLYQNIFSVLEGNFTQLIEFLNNNLLVTHLESDLCLGTEAIIKVVDQDEKILALNLSLITNNAKAIDGYVLVLRNITLEYIHNEKIRYMSYHDALTGLYNRRFFEEEIKLLDTTRQLPLSIIMGDVNGLKLTNDAFGHLVGDTLLKTVAQILQSSCRHEDVVARWGGDEFVILLPKTSGKRTQEICNHIRELSKKTDTLLVDVSVSLGFATKTDEEQDIMKTLSLAEDKLYENKLIESKSQRSRIIGAIQNSLYTRHNETQEHGERLVLFGTQIAQELELDDEMKSKLKLLGVLHDIGKIGISDDIWLKTGPLTEEEWYEIKKHSVIGFRIAESSRDLSRIAKLILHHHERWDGLGYPDQLAKEKIPLLSRIIAVVDAYDAMTSDRPYRKAMPKEAAIEELQKKSGTQFDPKIVEIFISKIVINQ